ncbi:MAG: sialidase family protein [Phycisphaerae bacterium]
MPPAPQAARDDPAARSVPATVQIGPFVSVQTNLDEFGNNIVGDAANEPSLAIDPTNPDRIAVGWRQFDSIASNFRQAGRAYSNDGGSTWTFPGVLEPGVFRSDPVLDADAQGNIYYLSLSIEDDGTIVHEVFKSTDGGVSFGPAVSAFGGDKSWIAIDRTGGIGAGNIYIKWQSFGNCCGLNTFIRSTDAGLTYMSPIPVPLGPSFGQVAVGPDGEVYVAGINAVTSQNFSTIVLARSTDARNPAVTPTFDHSTIVDMGGSMRIGGTPNPAGLLGQTEVEVDHSSGPSRGNVYLLGSVNPPGSDPLDVMFVRSTDGGVNWSAPLRVNDDPPGTDAWQWFGTMSVAPTGRIDAIWNDTRSDPTVAFSQLYYSFSVDTGITWSPNIPVSPVFEHSLGYPQQDKLGDYYEMISDDIGASVIYAATFNGEQDVYYLRIEPDCNENGVSDFEDIALGDSVDANGNGIPDTCEPPVAAVASRFIMITPQEESQPIALRVKNLCTGEDGWVSLTNSGGVFPAIDFDDGPQGLVNVALVEASCSDAEFRTRTEWRGTGNKLVVTAGMIAPNTEFEVFEVTGACSNPVETSLGITPERTWVYSDADGDGQVTFFADLFKMFTNTAAAGDSLWTGPDAGYEVDTQGQDTPDGQTTFFTDIFSAFQATVTSGCSGVWLGTTCCTAASDCHSCETSCTAGHCAP